jgi:hypothetical protein
MHRGAVELCKPGLSAPEWVRFVGIAMRTQAAALEQPDDPASNTSRHPGHFSIVGRRQHVETNASLLVRGVHAIDHKRVEVDVQIQCVAETLHECHGTALRLTDPPGLASPAAKGSEHCPYKYVKDVPCQPGVIRQAIAKGEGKRQHPLADGHFGKHAIDEVGRGVGHPAATAGRADCPALAGKCDHPVLAAGIAMYAQEAMRQHATIQKRPQFPFDEAGHATLTATLPRQESFELFGDHAIEDACLRVTGTVICRRFTNVETRVRRNVITEVASNMSSRTGKERSPSRAINGREVAAPTARLRRGEMFVPGWNVYRKEKGKRLESHWLQ